MNTIKVILADDHEIVRKGIKVLLESENDIEVIAEASDGQEALDRVAEYKPDVLIVDIRMPVLNGIETTVRMKAIAPETKVLVLSMHDDEEYITKSIDGGAMGYLLKDTSKEEFIKAVHTVYNGDKYFSADISNILVNNYLNSKQRTPTEPLPSTSDSYHLTKREKQILNLIYEGISNKDIANQLEKSIRTIETHRFNIMKKIGVNNITELLLKIERDESLKDEIINN